jgi:hypothetical protein
MLKCTTANYYVIYKTLCVTIVLPLTTLHKGKGFIKSNHKIKNTKNINSLLAHILLESSETLNSTIEY